MADAAVADRTLPHNLEAERSVLGAILLHNDTFNTIDNECPAVGNLWEIAKEDFLLANFSCLKIRKLNLDAQWGFKCDVAFTGSVF